jgi:membrane-associated phospholipid phosphatase
MAHAVRVSARPLLGFGQEAVMVIGAYLLYNVLRVFVEGTEGQAIEHSFTLVTFEQTLGLFHEETLHRTVESHAWLSATMQWIYLWSYLPILGIAAMIVFARDSALYRRYRNTMFLSAAIGLVIFAFVPVAPPRMLPEYGFLDPMHTPFSATSDAKNDFAAVPSFHFGFTLLAAMGIAHVFGWRRWLVAAVALLPAIMLVAIVATANHFFVDAAAGGAIVLALWWLLVWRPDRRQRAFPTPIRGVSLP